MRTYLDCYPCLVRQAIEAARLINGGRLRAPLVVHGGTGLPPRTVRRLIAAAVQNSTFRPISSTR